jgi:hypothetical protein
MTAAWGKIVIDPDTTADIFDPRDFAVALTAAEIAYYFNDAKNNSGNIMFPQD